MFWAGRFINSSEPQKQRIIEQLIRRGFESIRYEDLAWAIQNNVDIATYTIKKYGLDRPPLKNLVRGYLRKYWGVFESKIRDSNWVRTMVGNTPEKKSLLETPQGRKYLDEQLVRIYDVFYRFCWVEP